VKAFQYLPLKGKFIDTATIVMYFLERYNILQNLSGAAEKWKKS
jgi:hypothetical protein